MKARIVKVGNSKGIRIPKPLIDQVGLAEDVELEVRDGAIVISPAKRTRRGVGVRRSRRGQSTRGQAARPARSDALQ